MPESVPKDACAISLAIFIGLACLATAHAGEPKDTSEIKVCLLPLGKHKKNLMQRAARGISFLFGFSVAILDGRDLPKSAYYKPRKRYRADKILDYISGDVMPETDCTAIVGFTAVDISTTKGKPKDWGIYGLGEVGGDAAVVSSYRLARRRTPARLSRTGRD